MSAKSHKHKKRFGQNFLRDHHVIEEIISTIYPKAGESFVEIGPGEGALTFSLIEHVKHLAVIEIDDDLIPKLENKKKHSPAGDRLTIHHLDALQLSLVDIDDRCERVRVIGNLPYNISTPILFHLLAQCELIIDMHFMLQKEVVDRICASPGNKDYGRLSIMVQFMCEVEKCFDVEPESFYPIPKVTSSVLCLQPKRLSETTKALAEPLQVIVSQAFSFRRKTLSNALKGLFSNEEIESAGLDIRDRPEQVSVDSYITLSELFLQKNA